MECSGMCSECSKYTCRCEDCFALVEGDNGEWFCDEYAKPCEQVSECNEISNAKWWD